MASLGLANAIAILFFEIELAGELERYGCVDEVEIISYVCV
jgi:hypothetical protein